MIGVAGAPLYLPATVTPAPWTAVGYGVERMGLVITQSLHGLASILTGASARTTCRARSASRRSRRRDRRPGARQLHRAHRDHLDRDRAPQPLPDPDPRRRPFRRLRDRGGAREAAEPGRHAGRHVDRSWLDPATDGIRYLQRHHANGELTNRAANRPRAEGQDADGAAAVDIGDSPDCSGHRFAGGCSPCPPTLSSPREPRCSAASTSPATSASRRTPIRVFAGIEPGQPVTPEQLNLAVRKLFDTGLFEDVNVMPEAGRLVITVVENPTINQIAFEGNDALDDDKLERGDPAPPAARLLGAGGGGRRAAHHRGLPRGRALRRLGDPGHHPRSRRTGSISSSRSRRAARPACSGSASSATRPSPTAGCGG